MCYPTVLTRTTQADLFSAEPFGSGLVLGDSTPVNYSKWWRLYVILGAPDCTWSTIGWTCDSVDKVDVRGGPEIGTVDVSAREDRHLLNADAAAAPCPC